MCFIFAGTGDLSVCYWLLTANKNSASRSKRKSVCKGFKSTLCELASESTLKFLLLVQIRFSVVEYRCNEMQNKVKHFPLQFVVSRPGSVPSWPRGSAGAQDCWITPKGMEGYQET